MDEKDPWAEKSLESRRAICDEAEKVGKGRLPKSALPGNLLGVQNLTSYIRPTELEALEMSPAF